MNFRFRVKLKLDECKIVKNHLLLLPFRIECEKFASLVIYY